MSGHPFDNEFRITPEQREKFRRDGFVKLERFYNPEVVEALLARVEAEMDRGEVWQFQGRFHVQSSEV